MFAVAQTGSKGTIHALDHLRAQIAKIENRSPELNSDIPAEAWTSGHRAMDATLGGIGFGALHEIMPDTPAHLPVASAFVLGLIARLPRHGPLLWCTTGPAQNEHGELYAPGLAAFGIDPARIVSVNIRHPRDLSFVLEEAARLSSLAAIIAEGPLPSFTASRRLALLLATSGVPMLFLPEGKAVQGSAAVTRLLVSPLVAPDHTLDIRSPGPPAFRVTLARNRGGRPGLKFEMVFDYANLTFAPFSYKSQSSTPLSGVQSDSFPDRQFSVASAPERHRRA